MSCPNSDCQNTDCLHYYNCTGIGDIPGGSLECPNCGSLFLGEFYCSNCGHGMAEFDECVTDYVGGDDDYEDDFYDEEDY